MHLDPAPASPTARFDPSGQAGATLFAVLTLSRMLWFTMTGDPDRDLYHLLAGDIAEAKLQLRAC